MKFTAGLQIYVEIEAENMDDAESKLSVRLYPFRAKTNDEFKVTSKAITVAEVKPDVAAELDKKLDEAQVDFNTKLDMLLDTIKNPPRKEDPRRTIMNEVKNESSLLQEHIQQCSDTDCNCVAPARETESEDTELYK